VIAYLEGQLREKLPTRVVLDVSGVGYEVLIPLSTFYELPDEGKTVALRIHTHVREDVLQLFGFRSARERAVFELLLRTSGVGPKLAQGILSGIAPDELVTAIENGDVATLRAVPGVGTKTAERIVVDLRDRVRELDAADPATARARRAPASDAAAEEAASALVNLGYPRGHAERAVAHAREELDEAAPLEDLIRAALRRVR
jgi:Holliday junction DNA helicase RuvA